MPRSNGVDLVRALRASNVRMPIVMVSGVASPDEQAAAWEAGVDAYLDKSDLRLGALVVDPAVAPGRAPPIEMMWCRESVNDLAGWLCDDPSPGCGLVLAAFGRAAALVWSVNAGCERLAQREEVARQEAEEARHIKNDFVAMVSHELRTPLDLDRRLRRNPDAQFWQNAVGSPRSTSSSGTSASSRNISGISSRTYW